jgi:hypothetical protein
MFQSAVRVDLAHRLNNREPHAPTSVVPQNDVQFTSAPYSAVHFTHTRGAEAEPIELPSRSLWAQISVRDLVLRGTCAHVTLM